MKLQKSFVTYLRHTLEQTKMKKILKKEPTQKVSTKN